MLLPGFSTTVCPAPSLSPPNIPEVRSTGAWIGGASRDTERQPARLPGRSLTGQSGAGPCQLQTLITFHSRGFRGTRLLLAVRACGHWCQQWPSTSRPATCTQKGPGRCQAPAKTKIALGLEFPESSSWGSLPRRPHPHCRGPCVPTSLLDTKTATEKERASVPPRCEKVGRKFQPVASVGCEMAPSPFAVEIHASSLVPRPDSHLSSRRCCQWSWVMGRGRLHGAVKKAAVIARRPSAR